MDGLKQTFEAQAEWRRAKALEYPEDSRNLNAAEIFDHLAKTVSDIPRDVLAAWGGLFDEDRWHINEVWAEMLRQVGFYSAPSNAEELLRDLIAREGRS